MSLSDRREHERGKINNTEFLMKTCFQCKFWSCFVRKEYSYCHRCINNLRIPIKKGKGLSIVGLFDYYSQSETTKKNKNPEKTGNTQ